MLESETSCFAVQDTKDELDSPEIDTVPKTPLEIIQERAARNG